MPDFINNYTHALVRIAVFLPKSSNGAQKPLQLVGSVISLLNNKRDLPPRTTGPSRLRLTKNHGTLFYDELVMTAQKAVDWYRSDLESFLTPVPEQGPRPSDGKPLQASQWLDLPHWPVLGVRYDEAHDFFNGSTNYLPFTVSELTQFHRRLTADDKWAVEKSGSLGELIFHSPDAVDFLQQRLHINFYDYPEYLGGMCLLVPNTQVQEVKLFLARSNQGHESLAIQVIAKQGKDLKNLSVIHTAIQDDVLTHCQYYSVPSSGLLLIPHKGKLHQAGLVLSHEKHGVLLQQPLTSFFRQMSSRVNISSIGNLISAPSTDKNNAPVTTYTATDYLNNNVTVIGEGPDAVKERIARSSGTRSLRRQSKRYEQQWFSAGDREEALRFVRGKLVSARRRIIIVDPYFDKLQIKQLLYAVPQGDCDVNILTNADVFKGSKKKQYCKQEKNNSDGLTRLQKVEEFKVALAQLLGTHRLNNLTVLVAEHEESKFHDRFLIVDDTAWLLGSSLNSLGTQPTMIIRIPNPQVVITEIIALMEKSEPLDYYFKRLK